MSLELKQVSGGYGQRKVIDHSDDYSDDELDAIKRQLIQAIEEETA